MTGRPPACTTSTHMMAARRAAAQRQIAFAFLGACLILVTLCTMGRWGLWTEAGPPGNLLDGCHHVYLDMGTNRGVQIRKLYEPHLYPDATVLPVFDKYFGPVGKR